MSTFTVEARRITLHPIEGADFLELAQIDGTEYRAVVQKGIHKDGDLIVYIPEGAILPDSVIKEMDLVSEDGKTMLAGGTLLDNGKKKKDRVKALKLRGTLSQGIVMSVNHAKNLGVVHVPEDNDLSAALGIHKYEPPIPAEFSGKLGSLLGLRTYTDIENIKKYPDVFIPGEEVVGTEKLHGSCTLLVCESDGTFHVSSKGIAKRELDILEDEKNVYWRVARRYDIPHILDSISNYVDGGFGKQQVTLFGETLGVQDLRYGVPAGELDFRAFDIRVGNQYLNYDHFKEICQVNNISTVPELYRGPFDRDKIEEIAQGMETVTGKSRHVREGVVVKPVAERQDPKLGRVILKVINPKYLLRKGEATEYE